MNKKHLLILAGILALAVFFRFYQISTLPAGLYPDEAANGLDINRMQQGQLQPFYEDNNGREALFFYMLWGSVELFGKGPWQHHVVSAGVGVLAVLLCFLVTKKMFAIFSDPTEENMKRAIYIALLASFLMAISTWHVTLSRTAFRANLIPLFAAGTFYGLLHIYSATSKTKRLAWSAMTGSIFALGFYSYIAYRIMVPIMAVALLWPWLTDLFTKPRLLWTKKFALPTIIFIATFILFIFPLAQYFYTHPDSFVGRSSHVSIFNPDLNQGNLLGTFGEVTKQSLLGYFYEGDLNWRHNVSGQPFLPVVVSPFFAIGLVLSTLLALRYMLYPRQHSNDWKHFLLSGWFWGMLLPTITTAEGIPHGLRNIGAIPAVFILTAWPMVAAANLGGKFHSLYWNWISQARKTVLTWGWQLVIVCFVIALTAQSYYLYFGLSAASAEQYFSFRGDLTVVSNYINGYEPNTKALPAGKIPQTHQNPHTKNNTYLVLDSFYNKTVEYFTSVDGSNPQNPNNQPYTRINPDDIKTFNNFKSGDEILFTSSTAFHIKLFKETYSQSQLKHELRNKFGQLDLAVYRLP